MKQIKTLTVNGESYQITDPAAARLEDVAERMCPPLVESGAAVRCTPLADYPLQVVSHLPGTEAQTLRLHHCGKNLFDIQTAKVYHSNSSSYMTNMYVSETGFRLEAAREATSNWSSWGFYLGTAAELKGKTITLSAKVSTSITSVPLPWCKISAAKSAPSDVRDKPSYSDGGYVGSYTKALAESKSHSGSASVTYTVTGEEEYTNIAILFQFTYGGNLAVGDWTQWSDIQVEIGDTATAYEPYSGQTHTAQPDAADSYDWADIRGLPGVNTFWCDAGTLTVTGRADPTAELERLKNAVLALGGNL